MTVAAAVSGEAHHEWAHLLMILAAVGTFLSVGLKLPYFTWLSKEKPKELNPTTPPKNMHIGMAVVAFFCILHGIAPKLLYVWLPNVVKWNPFTMHHLVETVQILVFTFVVFWLMRKVIAPKPKIALDVDWFYRRPARFVQKIVVDPWDKYFDKMEEGAFWVARKLAEFGKNPILPFSKDKSDKEYTPDRYRPPAQKVILAVLAIFIIVVFLGFIL
jgi:multicomponent Na+:H+ antiporter subunit D